MAVFFGLISSFLYWKRNVCVNATLKRVRVNIVAMEYSKCYILWVCKCVCVCVCVCVCM